MRDSTNLAARGGGGNGSEGLSKYTYLLMLIKLWPEYWENQMERMNMRVDE